MEFNGAFRAFDVAQNCYGQDVSASKVCICICHELYKVNMTSLYIDGHNGKISYRKIEIIVNKEKVSPGTWLVVGSGMGSGL